MSARYVDEVASGRAEITERHKDRIRHGGVGQSGRLAQTNGELSAENVILSSDPLVLSLRQRSTYQQELIDTINRLRFDRWNDKQIADHFNHAGKLTPRGHQWVPQSVASIRKKAGRSGS